MDPSKSFKLARMFKGIAKQQSTKRKLRPIGIGLLEELIAALEDFDSHFLRLLLKAVFLIMYHGCFRIGEVVESSNPEHVLLFCNISFLYKSNKLKLLKVNLPSFKHSKDDNATINIPVSHKKLCPVRALLDYLKVRGEAPGQLFVTQDGSPVKRSLVSSSIKTLVKAIGKKPAHYDTHSFRIGRTTDMALKGVPEEIIKMTGRWHSNAFLKYIRPDSFTVPRA